MDIQEMVDDRIEKLRAIQKDITMQEFAQTEEETQSGISLSGEQSFNVVSEEHILSRSDKDKNPLLEVQDFGDLIDTALTEVAERILMISDQVAGDYARMEKDILNSRLSVLQSAEIVMDIAISLRRKASRLNRTYQKEKDMNLKHECQMEVIETGRMVEDSYTHDGRASMHEHGVASLFRRT